jgi:hypothetical protein
MADSGVYEDRDVFDELIDRRKTSEEVALLAYGIYMQRKVDWLDHIGRKPTNGEERNWISNKLPELDRICVEATQTLNRYASANVDNAIKSERLFVNVVKEVKAAGSFWSQLKIAVMTSFLAPILAGGAIAIALAYHKYVPFLDEIQKRLQQVAGS